MYESDSGLFTRQKQVICLGFFTLARGDAELREKFERCRQTSRG